MALKHILFDIDGTLINTRGAFLGALDAALGRKGIKCDDILPYFSLPLADAVRDFGFTKAEYDEWNADYAHRLSEAPLYDGADALIKKLYGGGVHTALVTSRKHDIAHIGLDGTGLLGYFDRIIAADDVPHPKPAPDPLLEYAKGAGCTTDDMAFVGDSVHDKECAASAGVRFFAPGWATIADELESDAASFDDILAAAGI